MKIWQRILLFVAVYICVLLLPWWLSTIILIGLTIYVEFYLEVLFFGFLFDTIYNSTNSHTALITALVLIVVVMFARTRVRT